MRTPMKTMAIIFVLAFALALAMRSVVTLTRHELYDPDKWTDYYPYNKSKQTVRCTKNLEQCFFIYQSGYCYHTCRAAEDRCNDDEANKLNDGNLTLLFDIQKLCEKEARECVRSCQNKKKPTWIARHRIWH